MISLRLFGGFSAAHDTSILTGRAAQRHRLALLALLAVEQPRGLSREKVIACLWPERSTRHGRNLLNQAVHALRQSLGTAAIVSAGDELRLSPQHVTSDVERFVHALDAGDAERAAGLYGGPLLDGFFLDGSVEFERWVEGERQRLRALYLKALEDLAGDASADPLAAVGWWQRLAAEDPCNTRVTLRLMESLSAAGDPAGAIRQAQHHTIMFRDELDAAPDPAVIAFAERLRTERPATSALTATGDQGRTSTAPSSAEIARSTSPLPVAHATVAAGGVASVAAQTSEGAKAVPPVAAKPRGRIWNGIVAAAAAVIVLLGASWIVRGGPDADAIEARRLAVLPLVNLMGDAEQDYFVDGMHDALITEMSRISSLTVLSRQSVMRYRGSDLPLPVIARELGVDMLVEGSVFRAGDSVRINVQLLRAEPEEHVWAQTYERAFAEALGMHGTVARAIAGSIHASMVPAAGTARWADVDPEAQEAYLRGVYERHRHPRLTLTRDDRLDGVQRSIAYFQEAVARAPDWSAAHAKLAEAYHFFASGRPDSRPLADSMYLLSKAAALRALELDETQAQAHASLGFVQFMHDRDWAAAGRSFERALQLDPNSYHWGYALYLMAVGRYDDAIARFLMAEEREPLSDIIKWQRAQAYSCAGRYDDAIAQASALEARLGEQAGEMWPTLRSFVAFQYAWSSRFEQAIAIMDSVVARTDSARPSLVGLAYVFARAGRMEEARALTKRFEAEAAAAGSTFRAAQLYAALGDRDLAADMLGTAVENRVIPAAALRCTFTYRELADHPRIQAVTRRFAYPD
jgi:DNA-binding SARP family transcriptional activator/TolB-like protein